jgi:hypothetical protein
MPPEIATLAAKGWKNLSSREKHTIEKHSAVLAARLRKQD